MAKDKKSVTVITVSISGDGVESVSVSGDEAGHAPGCDGECERSGPSVGYTRSYAKGWDAIEWPRDTSEKAN